MGGPEPKDITQLLIAARDGDHRATDPLLPRVYDELKALAEAMMREERPDHTLQATALVHEAYLRLVDQSRAQWHDRAHFFAAAAQALRRILVDHARRHRSLKRGGGQVKLSLDDELVASYEREVDLIAVDDALAKLAAKHPEHAQIAEMRFFAGLTVEEVAAALGVVTRTVERRWRFARAWLHEALAGEAEDRLPSTGDET